MRVVDHGISTIRFGDSLADIVNYLRTTPRVWTIEESRTAGQRDSGWTFGLGYDAALDLALKGWPDGTDRLAKGVRALPAPTATHHKRMHDVGGDFPDVARYLSGMPDSMIRRGRQTGVKPIVHLVVNVAVSANITAYQFLTMGTAMALVIDQLEASGRRVELDTALLHSMPAGPSLEGWKIKRADEHLDFGVLAFSLAHPASARRLSFALRERTGRAYQTTGYGYPKNLTAEYLPLIDAERALAINMSYRECNDTRSAVRSLTGIINAAAGETIVEADYD